MTKHSNLEKVVLFFNNDKVFRKIVYQKLKNNGFSLLDYDGPIEKIYNLFYRADFLVIDVEPQDFEIYYKTIYYSTEIGENQIIVLYSDENEYTLYKRFKVQNLIDKSNTTAEKLSEKISKQIAAINKSESNSQNDKPHIFVSLYEQNTVRYHFGNKNNLWFKHVSDTDIHDIVSGYKTFNFDVNWYEGTELYGKHLYSHIFEFHEFIRQIGFQNLSFYTNNQLAHFVFIVDRQDIDIPIEFVIVSQGSHKDYLIVKNPVIKQVDKVVTSAPALNETIFDFEEYESGFILNVLLIAVNSYPFLEEVDREVDEIESEIKSWKGIKVNIKKVNSKNCSKETLEGIFSEHCHYHIVHIAGHANYIQDMPGKSNIPVSKNPLTRIGRKTALDYITIDDLKRFTHGSDIRFIYLDGCNTARTGDENQLSNNAFLGLTDVLSENGVPAILGFRWPIDDQLARKFAVMFYKNLYVSKSLSLSLQITRRDFQSQESNIWLSPVLVINDY